jgi:hypothetical protein
MSEAVKEVKFINYLLRDIGIEVRLQIIVKTNNDGTMFMAQNISSGVRTWHVNTWYHFDQENVEDRIIKIEFIKSVESQSDIFTKNNLKISTKDTLKGFWRRTLKGRLLAKRFSIRRELKISITINPMNK